MAKSKITFTFLKDAVNLEFISFGMRKIEDVNIFNDYQITWTDVSPRPNKFLAPVNVTSIPPFDVPFELTSKAYSVTLQFDYTNIPATVSDGEDGTVVIEAIDETWEFFGVSYSPGLVTDLVENGTGPVFNLLSDSSSPATDICNNIKLSLETDVLSETVRVNGVEITNSNINNPVEFDVPRGVPIWVELESGAGDIIYYPSEVNQFNYLQYSFLFNSSIDVVITNDWFNGATVVVNVSQDYRTPILFNSPVNEDGFLILEYSLNDSDWFSSNTFTGQTSGSYTVYVRDQYGCKKQIDYVVTDSGAREPFLFISKANSISFSEVNTWDNDTIFKNDENTLSYEALTDIKYCQPLLFNKTDSPRVQFKSNFSTQTVVIRDESKNEIALTVEKMTSNLSRFSRLDAYYYKYKDGYTGIYFESGDTYDELNVKNGEYTLNGNLPDFAIKGQYVAIDGIGTFEIIDIVFDSSINKKVIVVSNVYEGLPTLTRVDSIYDLLPFEVYEFEIDFTQLGLSSGFYDILLTNTDSLIGTVKHLSENIHLDDEHFKTLHIRYFNDNNRDIFYKYGIEHIIRIRYTHIKATMSDESEKSKGDLTSVLTESKVYEINEFIFTDLTNSSMRKLAIALSCENVFINGVGYIKDESLSIENIAQTNLHDLTAIMLKTNINYNNNRQGQEGVDFGQVDLNIPAFITTGNGFIKT